ncbi:MAG TPA: beta-galactosidase GalA [Candidatus Acidoferrum sp.]|nr:beta-galactosidase GalA [Candidatus Acidoferrum sp.]
MKRRTLIQMAAMVAAGMLAGAYQGHAQQRARTHEAARIQDSLPSQESQRERLLMDRAWKFHLGNEWGTAEAPVNLGVSTGPARPDFDDSSWATVNLPHDWAVGLPFDRNAAGDHGYKPVGPGYSDNSVGWYRRTFTLAPEDRGKRIWIEFGGVFRDSRVYVNGCLVGREPRGYSSFRYDITDVVHYGDRNTVAVRVDTSQFEGWFYEGAGIYRHVWLLKTAPLAVAPDGTFVYSRFENNVPHGRAEIDIETRLQNSEANHANAEVEYDILDPNGKRVATSRAVATIAPSSTQQVTQKTYVASPDLWSPETPRLYKLVTTVRSAGKITDRVETEFGIRTLAFDPAKGFLLNGKPYAIKGTCDHQDHAGVGTALPDALQYFRVRTLKAMGSNAIRTAHNEPTEELLEACDRLGMLVLDESRVFASDAQDLQLLANQVRRDRNHPSVFLWSIGNEEPLQSTPVAARVARTMQTLIHQLDPSRSVTYAASVGNEFTGANSVTDVRGWNYHVGPGMDAYHAAHPQQPNIGTETSSILTTRGVYVMDKAHGYQTAYDDSVNLPRGDTNTAEGWWTYYAARPWLSGGFAWSGFDYRGENDWPDVVSNYGILDLAGFPKGIYYYYQAWWSGRPVLHLLPHWNWPGREGQKIEVQCFSNADEIELFLNGVSLGRKRMHRNSQLEWMVPYAPGTLLARGYKDGKLMAEEKVETTGAPAAIKLTPDRATINPDGEDVSVVTVAVKDAQGRIVPIAANLVHFDVSGPGKIIGVGNGDPSSHEPDVYLNYALDREDVLNDWRIRRVPDTKNRPEIAEAFSDADWDRAHVNSESGPLHENESAIFRTHVNLSGKDLSEDKILLQFGTIDDDGWVYVNGRLAGESHDWRNSPAFDIRKFLHAGENSIAVAVHNGDGPGGINKGVTLIFPSKAAAANWKRSVFNGLAQVIVQSGTELGEIRLTASADEVRSDTVTIQAKGRGPRPEATP